MSYRDLTRTVRKTTWQVYTSSDVYDPSYDGAIWAWVAYGPRGSDSGAETTPNAAVQKAQAAAFLLSEGSR